MTAMTTMVGSSGRKREKDEGRVQAGAREGGGAETGGEIMSQFSKQRGEKERDDRSADRK